MAGFTASWIHGNAVAPVILDAKRMKLVRVFIGFELISGQKNCAHILDLHLWDGAQRVAASSNHDFLQNPSAKIDGYETYELIQPRDWGFGLGVSFNLSGLPYVDGRFVDGQDAPVIVIGSAGADFTS